MQNYLLINAWICQFEKVSELLLEEFLGQSEQMGNKVVFQKSIIWLKGLHETDIGEK